MSTFSSNAVFIDEEKCIGCSLCVKDCPNGLLYLDGGKAHTRDSGCIECGHCYAVCPQHAIHMNHYSDEDIPLTPMTEIDSDTLELIGQHSDICIYNEEQNSYCSEKHSLSYDDEEQSQLVIALEGEISGDAA